MPERSPGPSEVRASFVLGAASVGAVVVVTAGAWIVRGIAGTDVAGFCRTSLASSTVLAFFLLRLLTLLGAVVVPILLLVALVRRRARKSLVPGFVSAVVLWLYFAGLYASLFQQARHPCMRSDATPSGEAAQVRPA